MPLPKFGVLFHIQKRLAYWLFLITCHKFSSPDGELGASLRYLSQRFTMPIPELKGVLTDIGREAPKMFLLGATAFFDAFATV